MAQESIYYAWQFSLRLFDTAVKTDPIYEKESEESWIAPYSPQIFQCGNAEQFF
jgi:hypothetical protein